MRTLIIATILVSACGFDPSHPQPVQQNDSSTGPVHRLKAGVYVTPDGQRATVPGRFFDTVLNQECLARLDGDGQLRCFPDFAPTQRVFSDTSCTQQVFVTRSSYNRDGTLVLSFDYPDSTQFWLGHATQPIPISQFYESNPAGECVARTTTEPYAFVVTEDLTATLEPLSLQWIDLR